MLAVLGSGLLWLQISLLSGRALRTREALEQAYPTQDGFAPWLDDAVPPQRMKRFLAVRRALQSGCEPFAALRGGFDNMGRRTKALEEMDEEAARGEMKELAGEGGRLLKRIFHLGQDVARFSTARNEALMGQAMGLGEYTWIYVTAYYGWLGHRPLPFPRAKEGGTRIFCGRVLGEVWRMAERHVRELAGSVTGDAGPDAAERLAFWRAEMEARAADARRILLQDGLPAGMAASLEPYRAELEELYCPETGELEYMRTVKGFLKYEHR